jgi:uncharacterized protein YndB with AHSA1/START domain
VTRIDADGTLSARDGAWVLRFERRLSHPAKTVWDAITDPEAMEHWFPQAVSGDLGPGGKLRFEFREDKGLPGFDGEVLEYDPPRVLAFTWGPDLARLPGPPGVLARRHPATAARSLESRASRLRGELRPRSRHDRPADRELASRRAGE